MMTNLAILQLKTPIAKARLRRGFTVVEILVVTAIVSLLIALILPAVQRSRAAARRIECVNKLRQIGLAVHQFEATFGTLPEGKVDGFLTPNRNEMSWLTAILPYCEQSALWAESGAAFDFIALPYLNPPHGALARPVGMYSCPEDSRAAFPHSAPSLNGGLVGLTSYLGVSGRNHQDMSGALGFGRAIRFSEIIDGLSNTLLAGERPPSADFNFGWWYTGAGQDGSGSMDMFLGAAESLAVSHSSYIPSTCASPNPYKRGDLVDPCHSLHFWSMHSGGAHFVRCDGSVSLISYEISVLEQLATRHGGEIVSGE